MASTGGGCNKRHRSQASSCTDDNNAEICGRGKRCGVAPRSATVDGDSGGDVQETADDAGGEDDDMYLYDCDDELDAEEAKEDDAACDKEQRYVVLTEDDVRARQEADTARVTEVLPVPEGVAAVLLRHFKWRVGRVQEECFSDDRRVRDAVGLLRPAEGAPVPVVPASRSHVCAICFDEYPAGRARSAGCSHYYCDGCWRGYIHAAVGDGSLCLSLRCPDPACSAAVVRNLVDAVADGEDKDRYARFALRSYVEDSGGGIRWCPAPGCTRAVEFLGSAGDGDATDVFCDCRNGFCWSCGEEAHRPVSCGTVRAWLAQNISEAETTNWILTNTKDCPSCRRPIEKNQGCNHMTCSAPCRHQFCWLCFDPWNDHKGCTRYDHRQRQQQELMGQGKAGRKEETRRRQAKASLDRYLYHYERWEANRKSLKKALADMDQLERSELERMAGAVDLPATELGFVTEAYHQIADGRRVLRWAHAYGYFLDPERNAAKRGLFDDLQSQANRWLECLHGCAELERKELFGANNGESAVAVAAETFRAYREKVANLTGVTRKFLGNLVKAFETDLPEVANPAFVHTVNAPTIGRQTVGVGGIISTATVKVVEPAGIPPMVSAPAFSHSTPMSNVASSQGISTLQTSSSSLISREANIANDSVQEHRPIINPFQLPIPPGGHGSLLSNPSLQQMVQSTALGSFGSNTSTVPGNSNIASSSYQPNSMGMGQQAGDNSLAGWPETMQIVRLIAQEHMNNRQYVGKAEFLIFQTLNQHGFLQQIQEKKLCAVIQLPSQTLLLSMFDKEGHLIGMLFPGGPDSMPGEASYLETSLVNRELG
ncbi:putative E3 ubiquitin-protein ligase ARI7 [Dichanthelium oligosanthes]|uniref:RBR-type E3 ubiquitin transferase n=1 Tax=Dichanthelium oligosanthes TaxID=888268 RepID=A0A1E5UZJ1_9POAL|nr:putative E3 ubiquitin-protein ligase ARI7 [Dichanthelium oligosanthes]